MRLDRRLERWRAADLVSADQAAAIRAFEAAHGTSATLWVVWGLLAAGGVAMAVGVIAIVAANWKEIPDAVKLAACGLLMLGTLAGAWRASRSAHTWPRDLFLLLHALLPLAMIGLVAQIYHLTGPAWRTMLLCAALALPVVALASRSLHTDLLLGYLVIGVASLVDDVEWLRRIFVTSRVGGWHLAVTGGLVAMLLARVLAGRGAAGPAAALGRWGVALVGVPLAAFGFFGWAWLLPARGERHGYVALAVLLAVGAPVLRRLLGPRPSRAAAVAALLAAALLALPVFLPVMEWRQAESGWPGTWPLWAMFVLFCAFAAALALAAASAGNRRWISVATFALAVRVVVFYLDVWADLMGTGVSLVATGLVICGVAVGWWRVNRALLATGTAS
jgi:uncharacterized membrane protein